jgi:hypothetical protein
VAAGKVMVDGFLHYAGQRMGKLRRTPSCHGSSAACARTAVLAALHGKVSVEREEKK